MKEVRINEFKNDIYTALIVLARGNGKVHKNIITMDARPSDAIALAAIAGAPLMVASEIIVQRTVDIMSEEDRKEKDKFKEFLEGIKASDFKLPDPSGFESDESDGTEIKSEESTESD